ncbi:MAG: ECF transporter S component [Clostridia bacterium]|nr:ECF transporter S component [Clostridia bacterium]
MNSKLKKLTITAMLAAMAYILMFVSKIIPAVEGFLQYDAKDVVITIGGFILGPLYALIISLVVSLLEFLTVSGTGFIGLVMNIVSTATFACVASFIYRRKKTLFGAFLSLGLATIVLTAVMLLWNYYITPLYMNIPRNVIIPMLPTVFLPFNIVKGLINSGFILFTYRPVVAALQKAKLVPANNVQKKVLSPALVTGLILIAIFIPIILHMAKVI